MKYLIALIAVALAGCAATPRQTTDVVEINRPSLKLDTAYVAPVVPTVDPLCGAFGKQAARIAELRDAKIAITDVPLLLTPIADFPAGPMIREVYARTDITPPLGARNSYETCTARGYEEMVTALKQAEAAHVAEVHQRIRDELQYKKHPPKRPAPPKPLK